MLPVVDFMGPDTGAALHPKRLYIENWWGLQKKDARKTAARDEDKETRLTRRFSGVFFRIQVSQITQ